MSYEHFAADLELKRAFWSTGKGIPTLAFSGQLFRARQLRRAYNASFRARILRTFYVGAGLLFSSIVFTFILACVLL